MNILQFTSLVLISIFLIPLDASAHCKGKHTGDHEHCTGGGGGSDPTEYFGSDGVTFVTPSDVAPFDYHIIGTSNNDDITAGSGRDLIEGGSDNDSIHALGNDDEIYGDDGNDGIDAGDGNDVVFGGAGNDQLNGGPGTDHLEGGDGNDELFFSLGASLGGALYAADHFDGNLGSDMLIFADWFAPTGYMQVNQVTVDLELNTYVASVTDPSGNLVTVQGVPLNIEGISGSPGNDLIIGSANTDNRLSGDGGNDRIYGLSGNDELHGSDGHDEIHGGLGDDFVHGGAGADILYGDEGDDVLVGVDYGAGEPPNDDILWGGTGFDTYYFRAQFSTDTIMDYEQDEKIILSGYVGGFWRNDFSLDIVNINDVGDDIVVDFWIKRGGGTGGTIILKGAKARGIVVDESDFIID